MQLGRDSRTSISDQSHEISQVAGVADRGFHALIGIDADNKQGAYPEIVEDVVKVRRREHATGGFVDDDLVADRGHFLDKASLARTWCCVQFQAFVPLTSVPTIAGQRLDPDMYHLKAMGTKAVLQIVNVRKDGIREPIEVVAHLVQRNGRILMILEQSIALGRVEVLHVDTEQRSIAVAQVFLMLGVLYEGLAIDRSQRISGGARHC